jgi:hypothetical protein
MDPRVRDLLKPEVLNSVNGLELIARIVVEGFMTGANKSQAIGYGQEFSQYRNYEPGDDLRQLDWKMYARSERYFIKQAEIETNITVKFVIDASHSMAYAENDISKLMYAKLISAALAYLARKQGDTFGLYTINDKSLSIIRPRFEQQQFMRFLHELIEVKAESTWRKGSLEQLLEHHGKELIVFMTDLYDEANELNDFIQGLKTSRNEVIVFHITGRKELELSHGGSFMFRDLETHATVKVDTVSQQKEYIERMSDWIRQSRLSLLEKGISYHQIRMNDSLDEVLRDFLKKRKTLMR